jgi:hypothetical protein
MRIALVSSSAHALKQVDVNSLSSDSAIGAGSFQSSRWTLVLAAGGKEASPSQSLEALSELCRIYWRPVYLFFRRNGHSPADAQDLTPDCIVGKLTPA